MDRLSRSVELVGTSYRVLMQDKVLFVLPVCSALVCGAAIFGIAAGFHMDAARLLAHQRGVYGPLFVIYFVTNTVGVFFQCALIAGATERMRGGTPTLASALGAALARWRAIVGWAAFSATIGVVIRIIHERVGGLGRLVMFLGEIAWSMATFLIVPVLVLEDRSVRESIRRSAGLLRKTWGESIIADSAFGFVFLVALFGLGIATYPVYRIAGPDVALKAVLAVAIPMMTFSSALYSVFLAALYRYATDQSDTPFAPSDLAQAFRPKPGSFGVTRLLR
jgi:hypothetical protein